MSVELVWEERALRIVLSGTVTGEDLRSYEGQIWGDWRFDRLEYAIWDGRAITGWAVHEDDIDGSVAYTRGSAYSNQQVRLALVVTEEVRASGEHFLRASLSVRSPWEIRLFHDMDEALVWAKGG